jgi:hypothetical protein
MPDELLEILVRTGVRDVRPSGPGALARSIPNEVLRMLLLNDDYRGPAVLIMAIGYQIAVDSEPGFRVQPSGRSRKLANRRLVEEGARACSFDCAWLFG